LLENIGSVDAFDIQSKANRYPWNMTEIRLSSTFSWRRPRRHFHVVRRLRRRSQRQTPRHTATEFCRPTKCKERVDPIGFFAPGPKNKLDLKWSVLRDFDNASLRRCNTLIYLSIL
jgi:hypothetical protein